MSNVVNPIPEGFHTVTPFLIFEDTNRAIDLYKRAFGAEELYRIEMKGKVGYAELQIGNSRLMLCDESREMKAWSPNHFGGSPISLILYVRDVDAFAKTAVEAGLKEKRPIADQFFGDRVGTFEDPFGYTWSIATHIENVAPDEMQRRANQL